MKTLISLIMLSAHLCVHAAETSLVAPGAVAVGGASEPLVVQKPLRPSYRAVNVFDQQKKLLKEIEEEEASLSEEAGATTGSEPNTP